MEHVGALLSPLPKGARLHDVFHVRPLKPIHGDPSDNTPSLPPLENGHLLLELDRVLQASLHHGLWHVLVH